MGSPSAIETLRTLTALVRSRGSGTLPERAAAPVAGLLLMLFAAAQEPLLSAADEPGLELFLSFHAALLMMIAGIVYASNTHSTLQRCMIYPVSPRTRYLFAAFQSLVHPLSLTVMAIPSLALTILYIGDSVDVLLTPLVVVLYSAGIGGGTVLAVMLAVRRRFPPAGAVVLLTSGLLVSAVLAAVAGASSILRWMPIVALTSDAIRALRAGEVLASVPGLAALATIPLLALWVARKVG